MRGRRFLFCSALGKPVLGELGLGGAGISFVARTIGVFFRKQWYSRCRGAVAF